MFDISLVWDITSKFYNAINTLAWKLQYITSTIAACGHLLLRRYIDEYTVKARPFDYQILKKKV